MSITNLAIPHKITFLKKVNTGANVYSFYFKPAKKLQWKAGQHGIFEINDIELGATRWPFWISSSPTENEIVITTHHKNDETIPFKRLLMALKPGETIKLRGPIGALHVPINSKKQYAFLATGVGVAPFRSILKQIDDTQSKTKVTLFFLGNKELHYFRDELSAISSNNSNVKINYIYKPDRITGQVIQEALGDTIFSTVFLLSGSSEIIRNYRRTLRGLGVPRKNIKIDILVGVDAVRQKIKTIVDTSKGQE
jgi:ferredoxin-NADP reductase